MTPKSADDTNNASYDRGATNFSDGPTWRTGSYRAKNPDSSKLFNPVSGLVVQVHNEFNCTKLTTLIGQVSGL